MPSILKLKSWVQHLISTNTNDINLLADES